MSVENHKLLISSILNKNNFNRKFKSQLLRNGRNNRVYEIKISKYKFVLKLFDKLNPESRKKLDEKWSFIDMSIN